MVDEEYVEFEIPYLLKLEDSIEQNPDWRFEIENDGQIAELRFRKEKSENYEYTAFPAGDRSGNLCWTKVQVRFPGGLSGDGRTEDGSLIEASREILNRFLEAYRAVMADEWIRELAFQDIVEFTVYWDLGSKTESRTVYVPNETFGSPSLEVETRDEIQRYLYEDITINPSKRIDLNTQEKIHRGEYELAVINAARHFEFWAKNIFVYLKEQRGTAPDEAVNLVIGVNISNLACNFFRDHLDFDFQKTDEYEMWSEQTQDIRNNVIHEGWHISEEQAQQAYQASLKAIARITEEFEDDLQGTGMAPDVTYPDT